MYFSLISNPREVNIKIRDEVKALFEPAYKRIFTEYRSLAESFLAKIPGQDGNLMLHQDWNYVDEKKFASATIWCPLVDITEQNGAMYAIKGSHKFFDILRSATFPTARIKGEGEMSSAITPLEVKAGEAIIFHQALWHGSYPNRSNATRVIATSIVVERDAPYVYFNKNAGSESADVYALPDSAFIDELATLAAGGLPQDQRLVSSFPYSHLQVEIPMLLEKARSLNSSSN